MDHVGVEEWNRGRQRLEEVQWREDSKRIDDGYRKIAQRGRQSQQFVDNYDFHSLQQLIVHCKTTKGKDFPTH